ncbi:acyltransferase [Sulfurimonas sp. HSL-1716]|uniref:acyltransferase n=1 Tax=Hydrocurvibacter sulfurireducens TaxID=3131937 RepID=UPI0031F7FE29
MFLDIINKIRFDIKNDRVGPDCPFTHWKLYFKSSMLHLCKKKFESFDDTAEFRAGAYAICCSKISIGKKVIIRPQTMIFADPRDENLGKVIIEDFVMMGSGVHIYTSNHKYDDKEKYLIEQYSYEAENVYLRKGCWIGANSIILPGVEIGENSIVGAGSVVTKNVPSRTIYAGNPAKLIKKI